KVFAVVDVGNFALVNVKRRYRDTAGNVIPVAHHVLLGSAHGESTALNKYQARTSELVLTLGNGKTTHFRVVIRPTGGGRSLFLLAKKTTVLTGGHRRH